MNTYIMNIMSPSLASPSACFLLLLYLLPSSLTLQKSLVHSLVLHRPRYLPRPQFHAELQLNFTTHCNESCYNHGGEEEVNPTLLKERLAFETLYADGSRTLTPVDVSDTEPVIPPSASRGHWRQKRQIYGEDGRFSIRDRSFLLDYPFSTAVRISTGCTGILVSPRHVLTAAHCVHDGKDYVKGARHLKVGFLAVPQSNSTKVTGLTPPKYLVRWARVRRTRVPKGWIQSPQDVSMDFDYALLELRWPHRRPFMHISMAPPSGDMAGKRIHFSGFDSDRAGELVYRFCPVQDESSDLIYQHCDARPGASGSGVYGRVWDRRLERWERRVIGVFSGHQWLEAGGERRDFNVAVRLTPLKFAQICYWLNGNQLDCSKD